ncbi:MAG: hypothetical protein NT062_07415 [Proteobacteria bacterium]|nr:hypothetical protein [Pseudomonadota bacterium]
MLKFVVAALPLLFACGDDGGALSSDEEARRAYLGLDDSIGKSLQLGFDGFNAATNANIPPQMTTGKVGGTLAITGQVDQGASNNKGMRLRVGMVDYTDGKLVVDGKEIDVQITYSTDPDPAKQPALMLNLKGIPTGTLDGTLIGDFAMSGDLVGTTTLNLVFSGTLADDAGHVIRMPLTTHVTGTATSGDGTFAVDLML